MEHPVELTVNHMVNNSALSPARKPVPASSALAFRPGNDEAAGDIQGGVVKRTAGILAMGLGVVGMVLSVLAGLWAVRLVTSPGGFADDVTVGVEASLERARDRLAFAAQAEDAEVVQQRLGAVQDGFAAAASAAAALDTHPLVSLLPVDVEGLEIAAGSVFVEDARDDPEGVLDETATNLAAAQQRLDDFVDRLRAWVLFAALLLVLVALWSVWAQYHLAGWGWRAWRANPPEA